MAPELGRVLLIENRPHLLAATRDVRKSKLSRQIGTLLLELGARGLELPGECR